VRGIVPAHLPAAPTDANACVRRVLVEDVTDLEHALLEDGVVVLSAGPLAFDAGVRLELSEERDVERWVRRGARPVRRELLHVGEDLVADWIGPAADRGRRVRAVGPDDEM